MTLPLNLEFVPTQDLIDELRRRSDVFFCTLRPLGAKDFDWQVSYGGPIDRVLGLIAIAENDLLNPPPPDDDAA
jgi:hypothetical protein